MIKATVSKQGQPCFANPSMPQQFYPTNQSFINYMMAPWEFEKNEAVKKFFVKHLNRRIYDHCIGFYETLMQNLKHQ